MERKTQDLPTWFLIFVAPTRVLFERSFLKRRGVTIIGWTVFCLFLNLTFLFTLPWLRQHLRYWLICFCGRFRFRGSLRSAMPSTTTPSISWKDSRFEVVCGVLSGSSCWVAVISRSQCATRRSIWRCPTVRSTTIRHDPSNLCTSVGSPLRRQASEIFSQLPRVRGSCA